MLDFLISWTFLSGCLMKTHNCIVVSGLPEGPRLQTCHPAIQNEPHHSDPSFLWHLHLHGRGTSSAPKSDFESGSPRKNGRTA